MNKRITGILVFFSFLLIFFSFINSYLAIKLWDYDFWWHLATGKYIVEHKIIPDKDPFSFVNNLEENKNLNPDRERLILKQYWLSQVIFFFIFKKFGDTGIIVMRSLILFSILFLVFLWFKKQNVRFYIIFPFIFFIFLHTMTFTGERPVLFTMLLTVVVFFILDDFKRRKSRLIFSLIPLMLFWANLHGGFIIGDILILTFIAGEIVNYFLLKRKQVNKKSMMTLLVVGIIAMAASAVNPNGFLALTTLSSGSKASQVGVQEYFSPFTLYLDNVRSVDIEYIILIVLFPFIAILRNKKIDIVYYIILCGFLYMSLTALRFVIYYVCIGAVILGRELHYILEDYFKRVQFNTFRFEIFISIVIFISSLLYTSGFLNINKITFARAVKNSVPKGATDFVKENKIQGNMFNDMGFGGYLIWELYPWKKVFIDTRQLNVIVTREFEWVTNAIVSIQNKELPEGKKPLWERLLDHYDINIVVIDTMDVLGATKPITFSLLKSDKWAAIYYDLISVIFVRDSKENENLIKKYKQSNDRIYDALINRLSQWALVNRKNPRFLLSLGDVFYNMGRYEDALEAYQYADRRLPNQAYTKMKIDITTEQMEKEKKL